VEGGEDMLVSRLGVGTPWATRRSKRLATALLHVRRPTMEFCISASRLLTLYDRRVLSVRVLELCQREAGS